MTSSFINFEGIAIPDSRKPRLARLVGHQDVDFKSREGRAYPAQHCNQVCWDFVSDKGDKAIADDWDLKFLD